jgi:hypothetical protein
MFVALKLLLGKLSLTQWIMIAMSVAILVLLGTNQYKTYKIESQAERIDALSLKIDSLVESIAKQNDGIKTLVENGKKIQGNLHQAEINNVKRDAELQIMIGNLKNKTIPKDCSGAMAEAKSFISKTASEWNK